MKITKKEVKKLAHLSKIKLTEKEIEKFTTEMDTIISSVKTLENFEKETKIKIKNRKFNKISFNTLREDKVGKSLDRQEILANAPYTEDGYIKIYGDVLNENNA